jgi:hypothetical protein
MGRREAAAAAGERYQIDSSEWPSLKSTVLPAGIAGSVKSGTRIGTVATEPIKQA